MDEFGDWSDRCDSGDEGRVLGDLGPSEAGLLHGDLADFGELRADFGELRTDFGELRLDFGELLADLGELRADFGELLADMGD